MNGGNVIVLERWKGKHNFWGYVYWCETKGGCMVVDGVDSNGGGGKCWRWLWCSGREIVVVGGGGVLLIVVQMKKGRREKRERAVEDDERESKRVRRESWTKLSFVFFVNDKIVHATWGCRMMVCQIRWSTYHYS
ncbi:hypothetical protein MtrunA17_Chr4g0056681 [Medicago truncatula]|uniref:Transmembrane protein, putative n=1 Tax=Medicago truncatula TaxID=3880 RepID=G7JK65_MEDTR|nr:transmembrane protein, putative [Medicago truncatula]RHN63287.1 hypothetical protein MtrunA17_Chr4g0056681 [Medicago truncatula]